MTKFNEHDMTYHNRDITKKFLYTNLMVKKTFVYPMIIFEGIFQDTSGLPSYISYMSDSSINIKIGQARSRAVDIPLTSGTEFRGFRVWHDDFDGGFYKFSVQTRNSPIIYRNSNYEYGGDWRFRWGWYQNKLTLFIENIEAENSQVTFEIEVSLNSLRDPATYLDIGNLITINSFAFDTNNPKDFAVLPADVTFINTLVFPEQNPVHLRSELSTILTNGSLVNMTGNSEVQSYEFQPGTSNPITKYIDTRYNYQGTFVHKLDKITTGESSIMYSGSTSQMLAQTSKVNESFSYFNTDLGMPVWKKGTSWICYDGANYAAKRSGMWAEKPDASLIYVGFQYVCYDKQTPESQVPAAIILHAGNNSWVDYLGRIIT